MQILISFSNYLYILLTIFIGLFIFWGNMYKQGFRNEKIWNFIVVLAGVSLILGKVLYIVSSKQEVNLSISDLVNPPFLVGGVIIGAVFVTSVLCNANNWSVYRAGDYVALSLNFFFLALSFHQVIFLFINSRQYNIFQIFTVVAYLILYIYLTRSIKIQVFSGYIFTIFLIFSSITESFSTLIIYRSIQFSHSLYFAIIVFAVINLLERYKEIKIMQTNLPEDFIDEMKERLEEKKKEVGEDLKELNSTDAFVSDKSREVHNAEQSEEAEELEEHYDNEASRNVLVNIKNQIVKALGIIKKGTYGVDEHTGQPINKARLEADPSATTNVENEK